MKKKVVFHVEISYKIRKDGPRQHIRMGNLKTYQTYEEAEQAIMAACFVDEWFDEEFSIVKTWQKDNAN
jgi:hypothetical protein